MKTNDAQIKTLAFSRRSMKRIESYFQF